MYLGAPLIGSNPHFYNGDPRYVNGVEGLNPNKSKHETYLILEEVSNISLTLYCAINFMYNINQSGKRIFFTQRTNTLLYAAKRVQLSIDVRKTRLSDTQNLTTRVFLPVLWYEEVSKKKKKIKIGSNRSHFFI